MSIALWLDDCRPMPSNYDVWVKTYEEAISHLKTGKVTRISFDNDLGTEKEGYDVAKWIAEQAYHGTIPALGWTVHSANPVGRANIVATMRNADSYWGYFRYDDLRFTEAVAADEAAVSVEDFIVAMNTEKIKTPF